MSGSFVRQQRVEPRPEAVVSPSRRSQGRRDPMPGLRAAPAGEALDPAFRASMETRLDYDFSRVRVHADQAAARSAREVGAQAFTVGRDIVLGAGAPSPGTWARQRLLAHELAHVVQQRAGTAGIGPAEAGADAEREADAAATAVTDGRAYAVAGRTGVTVARQRGPAAGAQSPDAELDEELKKFAACHPERLDPSNPEYARTLQDYGFKLTHQDQDYALRTEPKDPKARAEWKKRFAKSELLAGRILTRSGPQVEQQQERGQMLASDLATAGFVDESMALARQITDRDVRKFVYDSVLDRPDKVKAAQVAEITKFWVSGQVALTDNPVLQKLQAGNGSYAKKLSPDAVNAGLAELVKGYENDPGLPKELARVVYFDPASRAGFTSFMIRDKKGALLRKVSDEGYFAEGAQINTPQGTETPSAETQAWAIANKKKVTVDDILALADAAHTPIRPPAATDARSLRTWLEANTETIAQAVKKQHPNDPAAAAALVHQITDAFMYHVDVHGPDIDADPHGSIAHLKPGGPQQSQLQVDCDVLATYNVRFLVASGFTPVGYMALVPTDTSRAAHAMALLRYGKEWRAVSNMDSSTFPETASKDKALEMLRDFGISEAYDATNPLSGYRIYYQDSDARGTLPRAVSTFDNSALDSALSKP